ncbi:GntR family transcriptional regulator [Streptomyces sp. CWNU-52B]|uniref:GntR family transcriptional regulator n=1 Tax=unclassified Streptomyces TaxID=2593676 RepID=UPI0039C2EE5D
MADLTVAEHIRNAVRARVAEGRYSPGSCLPRQDKLAREFRVSRDVIGDALKPLKADGTLHRVPGNGTYVTAPSQGSCKGTLRGPVEQAVRKRIADGTYAPLTWIPTLRELATDFGISYTTVYLALAPLRAQKLLGVQRGMTYVIDPAEPTALPSTPPPFRRKPRRGGGKRAVAGEDSGLGARTAARPRAVAAAPGDAGEIKTGGEHGPDRHGMQETHA